MRDDMTGIDYLKIYQTAINIAQTELDTNTFEHSKRVAKYILEMDDNLLNEEQKFTAYIVAILHDVIEDGHITIETLRKEIPGNICNYVKVLSKIPSEDYIAYIKRVKKSISTDGKIPYLVKMADMKDHLSQKDTLTPKLKEKYLSALAELL